MANETRADALKTIILTMMGDKAAPTRRRN